MRRSLTIATVTSLSVAGLAGLQLLRFREGLSRGSEDALFEVVVQPEANPSDNPIYLERLVEEVVDDRPRPGSMQAELLASTAGNRNQIFWLTLRDGGYQCAEVLSAGALGSHGSAWRVSCGDALVYWIEIDEFGAFSVEPAPYGDIGQPAARMPRLQLPPQNGGERTLELIERQ